MAESEGFEPSIGINRYTLSRGAPSATRPALQNLVILFLISFSGFHTRRAAHVTCLLNPFYFTTRLQHPIESLRASLWIPHPADRGNSASSPKLGYSILNQLFGVSYPARCALFACCAHSPLRGHRRKLRCSSPLRCSSAARPALQRFDLIA